MEPTRQETEDPQARSVRARDHVREASGPRATEPGPRARIAGWPWLLGLVIAVGFLAWLAYAVWT